MNAFPMELSGGEKQRVAIARALMNEPEILLADEPTGNLDPDLAREILDLFLEINLRGTTVVLATHDRDTIRRLAKRVLMLDRGRLVDDSGPPPPRGEPRPSVGERDVGEPPGLTADASLP
jgi:cell division transport system ATP-binding protein